jgi:RimJ/RimL family protein N-acetyltransferase
VELFVRKATIEDAQQYFEWANDVAVRNNSFNKDQINWENHLKWFENKLLSSNTYLFIFYIDDLPVGQVRLDFQEDFWYIDYSIDREYRGKGMGTAMIKTIINKFPSYNIKAQVKKDNVGSLKVFEKTGFKIVSEYVVNDVIIIDLIR